jgi:signal transduction histidine kinase/DNA-binding response OmpR family regulator
MAMKYNQGASLTFEFVALFFQKNSECEYAYKLDGFDHYWNHVGTQRTATYTNLKEGTYLFRVKASNTDGVWTLQDANLQITILPPLYRTWWAYSLYVLMLFGILRIYRGVVQRQSKLKTELHFKQREVEHAQELEKLKTNLFTNISHEFRTPLTLILDPIDQLIQQKLAPERVVESYGIIQRNGQRLLKLINELLDLSKIEAERYRLQLEHADIVDFLHNITSAFQLHAERKNIYLLFHADEDQCMADFSPDALEKIVFNLISNAIKASLPGSEVNVQARFLYHNGQAQRLQLSIKDQGIGIPMYDQKSLFSRFFQANQDNHRSHNGSGIGLALTAELVKIHKGQISFTSQEEIGSTFVVDISINAADFPKDWVNNSTGSTLQQFYQPYFDSNFELNEDNRKNKQILIVEDNEELRNYLVKQLSIKYKVYGAEDGEEGWDMASTHLPDLIVSDIVMPKMNGIELCKKLKNNELTSHIPIILLTSKSSLDSQLDGLKIGADDYQTKPFKIQLLNARISNLIQQRDKLRQRFSKEIFLGPSKLNISETDEGFLKRVIEIIEKNLKNVEFDVTQLEHALGMSQMQLYRKLTSLTAMSGNTFIRYIRLQRAKQLLSESNLSISEIAFRVGFNSSSYFTRAYKKEFGTLPSKENIA